MRRYIWRVRAEVGTSGKSDVFARRVESRFLYIPSIFNTLSAPNRIQAVPTSLTFRTCGGLTRPLLGKTFFSTRRPALETGGQRPTARCALGREIVWISSPSPRSCGERVGVRGSHRETGADLINLYPLTRIASSMQSDLSPQAGRG